MNGQLQVPVVLSPGRDCSLNRRLRGAWRVRRTEKTLAVARTSLRFLGSLATRL